MQAFYSGGTGRTPVPGVNPMGFPGASPVGSTPGIRASFSYGMDADSGPGHQVNSANDFATVNVNLRHDSDLMIGFPAVTQPVFVHNGLSGAAQVPRMLIFPVPLMNRTLWQYAGYDEIRTPAQVAALFPFHGICKSDGATDPTTRTMYGGGARAAVVPRGSFPSCVDFWGVGTVGLDHLWLQLQARIVSDRVGDDDSLDTRIAKRARTDPSQPHPIFGQKGGESTTVAYYWQPVIVKGLGNPTPFDWSTVFKTDLPSQLGGGDDWDAGAGDFPVYRPDADSPVGSPWYKPASGESYKMPEAGPAASPLEKACSKLYEMAAFAAFDIPGVGEHAATVLDWIENLRTRQFTVTQDTEIPAEAIYTVIRFCLGQNSEAGPVRIGEAGEFIGKPVDSLGPFRVRVTGTRTIATPDGAADLRGRSQEAFLGGLTSLLNACKIEFFTARARILRRNIGITVSMVFAAMSTGEKSLMFTDPSTLPEATTNLSLLTFWLGVPDNNIQQLLRDLESFNAGGKKDLYAGELVNFVINAISGTEYSHNSLLLAYNKRIETESKKRKQPAGGTSAPSQDASDVRLDPPYPEFWDDVRQGVHAIEHFVGVATVVDASHYKRYREPLAVIARERVLFPRSGAECAKYVGDLPKVTIAVASGSASGLLNPYAGSRVSRVVNKTAPAQKKAPESESSDSDVPEFRTSILAGRDEFGATRGAGGRSTGPTSMGQVDVDLGDDDTAAF